MSQKLLVVEDEESIVTLLRFNLEQAGYTVISTMDGRTAITLVEREQPDLIILDLMLPGLDGLEVCKQLRRQGINTPILMLTAKSDEVDKVLGLELGADDYLTKPFSPRELVARVKAILRRSQIEKRADHKEERITIGELSIFPEQFSVSYQGKVLDLTPKEFELLVYLAKHKGRVLTREQLLNAVWNYDFVGDTRIVDVHISHLREKINKNFIKTVRGLGYKLEGVTEHE